MQGIGKFLLNVSETFSRLNVQHSYGSIELQVEEYLHFCHWMHLQKR